MSLLQLNQTVSHSSQYTAEFGYEGEWQHRATKLKQELDDLYECKREKEQELDKLREKLQDEKKWEQMEENEEKVMQLRKELEEEKKKSRQLQEEVRAAQDAVLQSLSDARPVCNVSQSPLALLVVISRTRWIYTL